MNNQQDWPDRLYKEADRIEEDCVYSAKGHFESARIWGRWNLMLGIPAVILAAAAGALKEHADLAAGFAFASAAVTAVLTFLKPSERAAGHQKSGTLYNSLKNRARFFKEIKLGSGTTSENLRKQLQTLSEARNSLNESSPEILRPAFERARQGIEAGEAAYRADQTVAPTEKKLS
jgi:hypothetical protein